MKKTLFELVQETGGSPRLNYVIDEFMRSDSSMISFQRIMTLTDETERKCALEAWADKRIVEHDAGTDIRRRLGVAE